MGKTARRFEELEVWQMARAFCKKIWEVTSTGTFAKDYKLRGQLESSSGSIMDNIAEGFERNGNKAFVQFLYIAKASCGESRSQLYRAFDRSHITREKFEELFKDAISISVKLMNLIKSINRSNYSGTKYRDRSHPP